MSAVELSSRERLLLSAALSSDPAIASTNWDSWLSQSVIEEAPYHELRLLPSVHANLSRIAPQLRLPHKVRGEARITFTMNNLRTRAILPTLEELGRRAPVLLAKGVAFCIRFNAWAVRPMGDVDIYVPFEALDCVAAFLDRAGWTPKYGLTWRSLVHRTSLRRGNWNVTKDRLDLDLHWGLFGGVATDWLNRRMWNSAEQISFLGRGFLVQSAEFAFASSLRHGFVEGTRGDMMQTILDAVSLLPICRPEVLAFVLSKAELSTHYRTLIAILHQAGSCDVARHVASGIEADSARSTPTMAGMRTGVRDERAVLRHPMLYRFWEISGRPSSVERLLLKFTGSFSKPLADAPTFKQEYDLTDCETIDSIAGPGFSWPEPEHTCFWSDGPDARLRVPLSGIEDHVLVLDLADHRRNTANAWVDVFANGLYATRLNIQEKYRVPGYSILIPKRYLFGPWVELSFRPKPYKGAGVPLSSYGLMRSIPFRTLRVYTLQKMSATLGFGNIPELYALILDGQEPYASKYRRIRQKTETSPFKESQSIPKDFNPIAYVLQYRDLFEAEVDPYEHYTTFGWREDRVYR